jgi:hypothetical protein
MTDRKRTRKKDAGQPAAPDQDMAFGELQRQADDARVAEEGPGPSPYDLATDAMPDSRVIRKGEREQPGPTTEELETAAPQSKRQQPEGSITAGDEAGADETTGDR